MIFLTLGTHEQPFTRALEAALPLVGSGESLFVQGGVTPQPDPLPAGVEWSAWMTYSAMVTAMQEADVVICHAGVGSIMLALEVSKIPVVMPRLAEHGEHVDDHQLQIVNRMSERGLVVAAQPGGDLSAAVERARTLSRTATVGAGRSLRAAVVAAVDGPEGTRVEILGPGAGGMGGIERFTESVLSAPPAGFTVSGFDTWGSGGASMVMRAVAASAHVVMPLSDRPDLTHINVAHGGSVVRKAVLGRLLELKGRPYVVHIHGSRFAEFERRLPRRARSMVARFLDRAGAVVVLGNSSKAHVVEQVGIDPAKVAVVPNGVAGPQVVAERTAGGVTRIVYAGRLGERKGTAELIRALGSLKDRADWTLCVAGNGDVGTYSSMAASEGIADRVEFTGWLDREAVQARLAEAEVFVLPSHAEGLPLAVLEAMSHGCAVVTTPVGNVSDVVSDGVNGLLVEPGDWKALAGSLASLLDDAGLVERLGGAARADWERSYSREHMVDELGSVWRRVLDAG